MKKKFFIALLTLLAIFVFESCKGDLNLNLTKVEVTATPTDVFQFAGNIFNRSGYELTAYYNNGKFKNVITNYKTSPSSFSVAGTNVPVEFIYEGLSDTIYVDVFDKKITGISISKLPAKLIYLEGEHITTTDLALSVSLNDKSSYTITEGFTTSPTDDYVLTTADESVLVSFDGKTTSYPIVVLSKSISGLEVTKTPTVCNYKVGESLNTDGMEVTISYNNGNTRVLSDTNLSILNIAPTTFKRTGTDIEVVVSIGEIKAPAFTVVVDKADRKLVEIEASLKNPGKSIWVDSVNATFEKPFVYESEIEVIGKYDDGTTSTDLNYKYLSSLVAAGGKQNLSIVATEKGNTFFTTVEVTTKDVRDYVFKGPQAIEQGEGNCVGLFGHLFSDKPKQNAKKIEKVVFTTDTSIVSTKNLKNGKDLSLRSSGKVTGYVEEKGKLVYVVGERLIFNDTSSYMFHKMNKLYSVEGFGIVETSFVSDMTKMFNDCSTLKSIDLSAWQNVNFSQSTKMNDMFYGCTTLTDLNISTDLETTNSRLHSALTSGENGYTWVWDKQSKKYNLATIIISDTDLHTVYERDFYQKYYGSGDPEKISSEYKPLFQTTNTDISTWGMMVDNGDHNYIYILIDGNYLLVTADGSDNIKLGENLMKLNEQFVKKTDSIIRDGKYSLTTS